LPLPVYACVYHFVVSEKLTLFITTKVSCYKRSCIAINSYLNKEVAIFKLMAHNILLMILSSDIISDNTYCITPNNFKT
jgi:hypothetical protein